MGTATLLGRSSSSSSRRAKLFYHLIPALEYSYTSPDCALCASEHDGQCLDSVDCEEYSPIQSADYVIISRSTFGCETALFECDSEGNDLRKRGELYVTRGHCTDVGILAKLGYTIIHEKEWEAYNG